MYVGMTFLLLSWSLFLSSPYTFIGALIFILYINRFQIQPEERALTTLFGSEFESYRLEVKRWL
jgi:protein-S-isoprenylcysteine O-methyltransferase Ste14